MGIAEIDRPVLVERTTLATHFRLVGQFEDPLPFDARRRACSSLDHFPAFLLEGT